MSMPVTVHSVSYLHVSAPCGLLTWVCTEACEMSHVKSYVLTDQSIDAA